ncbi:Rrf2 family transcriptional regulator [Rhodobacteraceae bacterium]|nr:Rrf2 family transcriptional regulator [Paracoccaceae bacterium]
MAHFGRAVEYGLHVLVTLASARKDGEFSAKDLAEFHGVPPEYLAKTLAALCKSGIVEAVEGFRGGYRLHRAPGDISFLDVVDAIEGPNKRFFECKEVRQRCVINQGSESSLAASGVCAIHAVMIGAEKRMREFLASKTIDEVANSLERKRPHELKVAADEWLNSRSSSKRLRTK